MERLFFDRVGALAASGAVEGSSRIAELEQRAETAEAELAAYRDEERIVGLLGSDMFFEGLRTRSQALDAAHLQRSDSVHRVGWVAR